MLNCMPYTIEKKAEGDGNMARRILVIGGGAAGLTAAAECARSGLRTLVIERGEHLGGVLLFGRGIYQFGRTKQILNAEHMRSLFGVDIAIWNREVETRKIRGKDGYQYEPWHIRYIGVDKATEVYESGLSLEEFLGVDSKYKDE